MKNWIICVLYPKQNVLVNGRTFWDLDYIILHKNKFLHFRQLTMHKFRLDSCYDTWKSLRVGTISFYQKFNPIILMYSLSFKNMSQLSMLSFNKCVIIISLLNKTIWYGKYFSAHDEHILFSFSHRQRNFQFLSTTKKIIVCFGCLVRCCTVCHWCYLHHNLAMVNTLSVVYHFQLLIMHFIRLVLYFKIFRVFTFQQYLWLSCTVWIPDFLRSIRFYGISRVKLKILSTIWKSFSLCLK